MPRFRRRRRIRFRRRRYGRRRRYSKKKVNNRPWGKVPTNGFSWPRRARFALPIKRTSLLKTTYYEDFHNPTTIPYIFSPPTVPVNAPAGSVAYWLFNPFHWQTPYGPWNYVNPAANPTANMPSVGIGPTHSHAYRWKHEVENDHMEYNPLFVRYTIRMTPITGQTTYRPAVCGVFVTARDKDNEYVVPLYNGEPDHTEVETWESWPGGRYMKLRPSLSNGPTGKTLKGTIYMRDFQVAGGTDGINKNWFPFDLNAQPGYWPVIVLWYGREVGAAAQEFRVSVRFTMFFRARRLSQLDPLEQRKIIPVQELLAAKATIDTLQDELARLRDPSTALNQPLGSLAFPRESMTTSTTPPPTSPTTPQSELPMSPSDLYYTEWSDSQDEPDSPTTTMEDPL